VIVKIRKEGGLYTAEEFATVAALASSSSAWRSPQPMPLQELYDALKKRGRNPIDIVDAFYECDPDWAKHHPEFRT
jgi:hypothetical protein